MTNKKDLVKLIRENPGARFMVDNDSWWMLKRLPENFEELSQDQKDSFEESADLCNESDVKSLGDGGYGSGNCYGGDILQALAVIVGVSIESV